MDDRLRVYPLKYNEQHKILNEEPSACYTNDEQNNLNKDTKERFKLSIEKNLKRIAKLSIVDENRLDQSVDSWGEGNSPVFLK